MTLNERLNCTKKDEFSTPGMIEGLLSLFKSFLLMDKQDEKAVGLLKYNGNITYKPVRKNPPVNTFAYNSPPFKKTKKRGFERNKIPAFMDQR